MNMENGIPSPGKTDQSLSIVNWCKQRLVTSTFIALLLITLSVALFTTTSRWREVLESRESLIKERDFAQSKLEQLKGEIAERTENPSSHDEVRSGQAQDSSTSQVDSNPTVNSVSSVSPELLIDAYQKLAAGYLAQAQVLKTARTPGRQQKALELLKEAASLRSSSQEIQIAAENGIPSLKSESAKFWQGLMPMLRNEAISWLSEASLQPVVDKTLIISPQLQPETLVSVSPDGALVAVYKILPRNRKQGQPPTEIPGEIEIYDLNTGERLRSIPHKLDVQQALVPGAIFFNGGRDRLIIASAPRRQIFGKPTSLRLERLAVPSGDQLETTSIEIEQRENHGQVNLIASKDGKRILVQHQSGTSLWEVAEGRQLRNFTDHSGTPRFVGEDGKQLMIRNSESAIGFKIIDVDSGKQIHAWEPIGTQANSLSFNTGQTSSQILLGKERLFSLEQQSSNQFRANQNSLKLTITNMVDNKAVAEHVLGGTTAKLDLSEDGQYIAVLTSDRLLLIEAESGRVMQSHRHPHISLSQSKQPSSRSPLASTWEPLFLSFVPNQQKLVTVLRKTQSRRPSEENLLQIWDISIPQKTEQLVIQQKSAVHALEVGVQKEIILSGSSDAAIRLFDHAGEEVWARTPSTSRPNHKFSQPSFDPSGTTFRTVAHESLRFVDAETGELRREFPISEVLGQRQQGELLAVKQTTDGRAPELVIYEVATNQITASFHESPWNDVHQVRFSPDGTKLLGFTSDQIVLGEIETGKTLSSIKVPENSSRQVFSFQDETSQWSDSKFTKILTVSGGYEQPPVFTVFDLLTGKKLTDWQLNSENNSGKNDLSFSSRPQLRSSFFGSSGKKLVLNIEANRKLKVYVWDLTDESPKEFSSGWTPHSTKVRLLLNDTRLLISGKAAKTKDRSELADSSLLISDPSESTGGEAKPLTELWDVSSQKEIASTFNRTSTAEEKGSSIKVWENDLFPYLAVEFNPGYNAKDEVHHCDIWDVKTGDLIHKYNQRVDKASPDGRYLVLDDRKSSAKSIVDMMTGEVHSEVNGLLLAFSPDSRKLFTMKDLDGQSLTCWRLAEKQEIPLGIKISDLRYGPNYVSIPLSPDGRFLITSPNDSATVELWDLEDGSKSNTVAVLSSNSIPGTSTVQISGIQISPDGTRIAMGVNHQIRFASLKTGVIDVVLPRLNHSPFFNDRNTVRNDSLGVETVAMSRDGQVAASGGVDRTVCLWECKTGRFLTMLEGFESTITDLCFSPNGDRLVTLENAGRVVLWEVHKSTVEGQASMTAKVIWQTDGWDSQSEGASSLQVGGVVAFGPHGTQLAVGLSQGIVYLVDAQSGKPLGKLSSDESREAVTDLAFSSERSRLLVAHENGIIQRWDLETAQVFGAWDSGHDDLKSFGLTPDESLLVTGGEDVRLWNFETSELLMKIRPHSGMVRNIAFAENGRAIVSASDDGTIVIWTPEEISRNLEPYGLAWGSSAAKGRKNLPVLGVEPNVPVDKKEMPANQTPQDAKGEGNDLLDQTDLDLPGALRFAQVLRDQIDESLMQRRERFETDLFPSGDAGGQRSLEQLLEDAQSRDSRMRAKAIEELGQHHAESDKVLPALIIALNDNEVHYKAVASIGKMGTKAKPAIPSLLKSFQSNIRETQDSLEAWGLTRSYQLTLEKIGEVGLPELIQGLSHEDEKVRELVASSLANMRHRAKPAVPALAKSLSDKNKQVRDRAAFTLGKIGLDAKEALPALEKALNDEDDFVRRAVANSIWEITGQAELIVPVLIEVLRGDDPQAKNYAMRTLGEIGDEAKSAIPMIKSFLSSDQDNLRETAAVVIVKFDTSNEKAVEILLSLLREDQNRPLVDGIYKALGHIGREQPEKYVPLLIELLQDFRSRSAAAVVLGYIGPSAQDAIPHLEKLLSDGDLRVNQSAVNGLSRMGPKGIGALIRHMKDLDDPSLFATSLIRRIAPQRMALKEMVLQSGVHADIIEETQQLPDGSEHIPNLIEMLNDTDARVTGTAVFLLGQIGEKSEQALVDSLTDPRSKVRGGAALALSEIPAARPETESALQKTLENEDPKVRWAVIIALGSIDEISPTSVLLLQEAAKDKDERVRIAAEKILLRRLNQ